MLDSRKLEKTSENVDKKKKSRERRYAQKTLQLQKVQARKVAKKLIPEAEKKVEKAAKKGLDRIVVYAYTHSFGSLQNMIANIIETHFCSMNFRTSRFTHEEEGCYYGTDVMVHIRESV